MPKTSRLKEGSPSFFFRKSFFHSLGDKCQTAAPGGPSTPPPVGSPAPAQDLGHSRSRIVIEPASVPEAAAKPALRHAGLYGARLVAWIPFTSRATGL